MPLLDVVLLVGVLGVFNAFVFWVIFPPERRPLGKQ